jgi:hypothetical protein
MKLRGHVGGVTDGVADARVRNAGHEVDLHVIRSREGGTTAVATRLDVDVLVARGRVAVVDPEEGADLALLSRWDERFDSVARNADHLSGSEQVFHLVTEIRESGCLHCDCVRAVLSADSYRGAAEPIASSHDAPVVEDQQRTGAVDQALGVRDPVLKCRFAINQICHQLGGVDLAIADLGEMGSVAPEQLVGELLEIVHLSHGDDGVRTEMGRDDEGLVLVVADDAKAHGAVHRRQIILEFAAELGVCDVVDRAGESVAVAHDQATALSAEV